MNAKRGRAKKLFAKLLLILFGFFLGGIVSEIALRVAGYSYPEFYSLSPSRGYSLRPQVEGWYRKEGEAYTRINSDGLRDQEHTITKPQGTFRIAVLGDSYPEALSVSMEEAFWSVMERKLGECGALPGKRIEVINFGVSGYSTAQELLTLREQVWKYAPDLVLLAVTTNNDITDNARDLKKTDIPYFVYKDNHLTLDDSFKNSRAFLLRQSRISRLGVWLRDHSRLVQALMQGHHGFKILLASWRTRNSPGGQTQVSPARENADSGKKPDLFSRAEELGTDNLIYLEPDNPVWNDAWRVTEGLILEMRDEVTAKGAKFVVVTLSNGPQVLPNPESRESFKKWFGVTDLFYPDNRIRSFCVRERIPVLTLAPELQEFAERNKTFIHGFGKNVGNGHWNATGHRVAGELIAKKICEGQLLK
ncbi:MAG: SGNH/GDSL hydrolase family protein [Acidobacteriota bacterium]|nr:SGNH/GDSL hydrolase family protein [Acidobacteriota bacterium]